MSHGGRNGSGGPPPSAAKLSSLATNTLTKILELNRLTSSTSSSTSQPLPIPPSLPSSISSNLQSLSKGISSLSSSIQNQQQELSLVGTARWAASSNGRAKESVSEELRKSEELLEELERQYGRLLGLCEPLRDLGVVIPERMDGRDEDGDKGRDLEDDQERVDEGTREVESLNSSLPAPHLPRTYQANSSSRPPDSVAINFDDDRDDDGMDEADVGRENQETLVLQKRLLEDQDAALDALSLTISRQRDLSQHISDELDVHNALLEDTEVAVDRTTGRLRNAQGRLNKFARGVRENSATWGIGTLIVLLIILILIFKY